VPNKSTSSALGSDFPSRVQVTVYGISERDSFLNFAPQLLEYLMHPERPSLLAKIVGAYQIKIRLGKETKRLDLIVMENILHGRSESLCTSEQRQLPQSLKSPKSSPS
jgi:hypothetical protein